MKITIECNTNELKELINKNIKVNSIKIKEDEYVDLGLPSGTLWKNANEGGDYAHYTYDETMQMFSNKLPTKEQLEELKNECEWIWTGNGYEVTGPNGKSIMLPPAGDRYYIGNVCSVGTGGRYWSATPYDSGNTWYLYFNSSAANMYYGSRCHKQSVRLVK